MVQQSLKKTKLTKQLKQQAKLLQVIGDPVRIRILCLLYEYSEACVSDVADSLDMSVASVSHHLKILKSHHLLRTERRGTVICYILVKNELTEYLRPLVCVQ